MSKIFLIDFLSGIKKAKLIKVSQYKWIRKDLLLTNTPKYTTVKK